jgi:hypothetical protein
MMIFARCLASICSPSELPHLADSLGIPLLSFPTAIRWIFS